MATRHRLKHHAGSLWVVEWHALKDRLLSDVGRTVRIASMTLTARRIRPDVEHTGRGRPPQPGRLGEDAAMEVLSSRILLRPSDTAQSQVFYRDVLGLAVYREFGPTERPGVVFFLGNGLLEVSGQSEESPVGLALWLQVRNVAGEHDRLATAGVTITQPPRREPWGLVEMWIEDPDGVRIALVEVPDDHPLRRDQR